MPKKTDEKQKPGRRTFPEFDQCLKMMRRSRKRFDEGFECLRSCAFEHVDRLVVEFYREENSSIRWALLELLGEARSEKALPIFVEAMMGDDHQLWSWAIFGLNNLATPEARRLLWEARSYTKGTEEDTKFFREQLEAWREEMEHAKDSHAR